MKVNRHLIVSLGAGGAIWLFTQSLYAGIVCFISGVFVDIDHFIDYIIHHGINNTSLRRVYQACEQTVNREGEYKFTKLYLIFHVAELAILLCIIAIYTRNIYVVAIALGYSIHLALDSIGNPFFFISYFIIYRTLNGFNIDRFFKKTLNKAR